VFLGEKIQRIELSLNVVHMDFAFNLGLTNCHLANVHVPHLAIGPAHCSVNTAAVIVEDFLGGLHDKAQALGQLAALVGGVNLQFAGATTHPFLLVTLPGYGTPHLNHEHSLERINTC
jgi:hypothetical protein